MNSPLIRIGIAILICTVVLVILIGCGQNCRSRINKLPPADSSAYILPYPVGKSYRVFQTCCDDFGHDNRLAYDFRMPMGAEITAVRGGLVIIVLDRFRDDDFTPGHNNRVLIRHEDLSVAWYGHLQQHSIVVAVGDTVTAGQLLGKCGTSGRSGNIPHLHFEVFRSIPYDYDDAIVVNFRNAGSGKVDSLGVLMRGEYYLAVGY